MVLQRLVPGLHVGGKTALDWYGVRHYVGARPTLELYGWSSVKLPAWFVDEFPSDYHRKRLFNEPPTEMLGVTPFEGNSQAPLVSSQSARFSRSSVTWGCARRCKKPKS